MYKFNVESSFYLIVLFMQIDILQDIFLFKRTYQNYILIFHIYFYKKIQINGSFTLNYKNFYNEIEKIKKIFRFIGIFELSRFK